MLVLAVIATFELLPGTAGENRLDDDPLAHMSAVR
jgi:hypothetical protein